MALPDRPGTPPGRRSGGGGSGHAPATGPRPRPAWRRPARPGPPASSWQLELLGHLDAVELGGVQAEDLLLAGRAQPRVVGELVAGVVPVDESLDLPLGLPDAVVAAEGHLVLADPEQQLAHDLGEELGPGVHQAADDHGQAGVDVGLLRRHEAEVLDPRQADVLDDEVQVREVGRGVVDVGHVERVLVQRPDRRALVHVDVLDAEVLGRLQVPVGARVAELVAARAVVPLGGVELDALGPVAVDVLLELLQAVVAVAGVEPGVVDELARGASPPSSRCARWC